MQRISLWSCALALLLGACGANSGHDIALGNADFEEAPSRKGDIPGWFPSQHAGDDAYAFDIDRSVHHHGAASFRIQRLRPQVYGMLAQRVDVSHYVGKTIELSAWMASENVGREGWGLMLTFSGDVAEPRLKAAPLTGTQALHEVTIRTLVPAGAKEIEIAAILLDGGTAWLDDVHLRVIE